MTIEELKQALKAATKLFPSPWARDEYIDQIYSAENRGAVVADVRGWGYLTGTHGLDYDAAVEAQNANARLIVEAVNNLPKLLKVAEAAKDLPYLYDQASADPYDVGYSQVSDEIELLRKALEAFK